MIDPRVTRSAMLMMVGKNYGGMFSQLDAKYGKKSAPKKQHYTNVIRSWRIAGSLLLKEGCIVIK